MDSSTRKKSHSPAAQANDKLPADHPVIIAFSASRGGLKSASAEQPREGVIKRISTYFHTPGVGDLDAGAEAGQRIVFAVGMRDSTSKGPVAWAHVDEPITGLLALLREGDLVGLVPSGPASAAGRKAWTIKVTWNDQGPIPFSAK